MRMSLSSDVFFVSPGSFPTSVLLIRGGYSGAAPRAAWMYLLMRILSVRFVVSYRLASGICTILCTSKEAQVLCCAPDTERERFGQCA